MAQNARCNGARVRDEKSRRKHMKNQRESIMERFDEMVNAQLHKQRTAEKPEFANLVKTIEASNKKSTVSKTLTMNTPPNLTESDNELTEAVDCLIRAEDMLKFAEKIVAAEAAVAAVPPELAEEAALAVTRSYRQSTDRITKIREVVKSDTLIEVVGYIGIRTRKQEGSQPHVQDCSCTN